MVGQRGDKEVNLQTLLNAFRLVVHAPPSRASGLELLHHMDRDYLRGLIEASNSASSLNLGSDRHRATSTLENVREDESADESNSGRVAEGRQSVPYNPMWGHLDKRALPPVGAGRDSNSSELLEFDSPFAVHLRKEKDTLPGDGDPLGRGLIKQGSDLSTMSSFFNDD